MEVYKAFSMPRVSFIINIYILSKVHSPGIPCYN